MNHEAKVYVAGSHGMVGSSIVRLLKKQGYKQVWGHSSQELDLTDGIQTQEMFQDLQPEYVFLAAAKVGGIHANNSYPADFIYKNIAIQNNVIHSSYLSGVKKLLFLGSSCIYPKMAPQPIKEEYLLSGPLESTNEPYAIAKIAGIKMCEAYNKQYGTSFMSCMPTNLYGPNDNYDLQNSHVLPALIRKVHEAKERGDSHYTVWGTGKPLREFLYVDDLAEACLFLMNHSKEFNDIVNIGSGEEVSIRELAFLIAEVIGFSGDIIFDPSKPDGTPRKRLDNSRIETLGWKVKTTLREGIQKAYEDFVERV